MAEPSDQALVTAVLAGDADSFRAIVERYQSRIVNLAYHFVGNRGDAEDVAQEAFVKAYFSLSRFREGADLLPWLYKITTNTCFTLLKMRRPAVALDEALGGSSVDPQGQKDLREIEDRESLLKALQLIPPRYRIVILLYYAHDLSYQQIGEICGLPLNTVRTNLKRGKELLKSRLEGAENGR